MMAEGGRSDCAEGPTILSGTTCGRTRRSYVDVLILLSAIAAGCGPGPYRPCLSPWEIALAVPTLGIYNLACAQRANAQQYADWQATEVERCVQQGGDPAACRVAVYGTLAPRTNVKSSLKA